METNEILQLIAEGKSTEILNYIDYLEHVKEDYELLKSKIKSVHSLMEELY